jgi:hypothetical protein
VQAVPFCGPDCHRLLYAQHRSVCGAALTRPLLPSQIALRMGLESYCVQARSSWA